MINMRTRNHIGGKCLKIEGLETFGYKCHMTMALRKNELVFRLRVRKKVILTQ